MRRALFTKREEPASSPIPNPATKYQGPNVSQYGWTTYEVDQINQLVQYVEMARLAAESASTSSKLAQEAIEMISNLKDEVTGMYGNMSTYYANMLVWYTDFSEKYYDFKLKYTEVQEVFTEIRDLKDKVDTTHRLVEQLAADTAEAVESSKQSAAEAEASNIGAKGWFDKSYELYLDLSHGIVYRGTWNPNSGAYPTEVSTNARWDVILDPDQLEAEFDGKRWFWGDRLLYSIDTKSFTQVESGTTVQSVNGKTGAVLLNAADVGALPLTGGVLKGGLAVEGSLIVRDRGYGFRTVESGGHIYLQGGKTEDGDGDQKLVLSGYLGKKLTKLDILTVEEGLATVNGKKIFTEGNKPSADNVTSGTFQGPGSYNYKKEVITLSPDSYRIAHSGGEAGIGSFWRNDGANLYLLFTANGKAVTGGCNDLRPISFDLKTGLASFYDGLVTRGLTSTSGHITAQEGHLVSQASTLAALSAHNTKVNKALQVEVHDNGQTDLAVKNAADVWEYPLRFEDGGKVITGGQLQVQSNLVMGDGDNDSYITNKLGGQYLGFSNTGHLGYAGKSVLLVNSSGALGYFDQDLPRVTLTSGHNNMYEHHIPGKWGACTVLNGDNGNLEWWETDGAGTWNITYGYWIRETKEFYGCGNGNFNDVFIRSDGRLKHHRKPITNALEKIDSIEGLTYDKQSSLSDETILKREAGIIAQDLRKVLPEAVNESDDTTLTISNSAVNALLLQAIKELKAEVDQLKRDLGR